MFININFSSKNLKSLNLCLTFFLKLVNSKRVKIKIFKKVKPIRKTDTEFTILKSPHVNKTAQEQFKSELFNYKLYISYNFQFVKLLFIIKQLNTKIFVDVNLVLKFILNKKNFIQNKVKNLNYNRYSLNFIFNTSFLTKNYFEILSFYGEKRFKRFV